MNKLKKQITKDLNEVGENSDEYKRFITKCVNAGFLRNEPIAKKEVIKQLFKR